MKKLIILSLMLILISCKSTDETVFDYDSRLLLIQNAKESVLQIEQDSYLKTIEITMPESWDYYKEELPSFESIEYDIKLTLNQILHSNTSIIVNTIFKYLINLDLREIDDKELVTLDSMTAKIAKDANLQDIIYNILNDNIDIINEKYMKAEKIATILKTNLDNLNLVDKKVEVKSIEKLSIHEITESIYIQLLAELAKNEIKIRNTAND